MTARQQKAVRTVKDTANAAASEAKARLTETGPKLSSLRDAAVGTADAALDTLSDAGERLAETLRRAVPADAPDAVGSRLLDQAANGLASASDALRHQSVSDLAANMRGFARRHPAAFMAAAALAGFAAARMLRPSSRGTLARQGRSPRGPV